MIVLTIADLINSINLFSTVFTPCLIACPSLSGIWACGPHPCPACKHPSLRDFVAPEALRHPCPACGGALQMKTKNQRSSELDADFLFSFAEREGFEPPEPFSSTVFKTAVIDHSTISPRTFRWDVSQTDCKGKQKF